MVEYEVINERENKLLNRRELEISIPHSGAPTPSKALIQGLVSEKEATEPTKVVIDKILSGVGRARCKVFVDIYEEDVTDDLTENAAPEEDSDEGDEESETQEESSEEDVEGENSEEESNEDEESNSEEDDNEEDEGE